MSRPLGALFGDVIAYEAGELSVDAEVEFFQGLIDTGLAWQLQGCYGRHAMRLINAGECRPPEGV